MNFTSYSMHALLNGMYRLVQLFHRQHFPPLAAQSTPPTSCKQGTAGLDSGPHDKGDQVRRLAVTLWEDEHRSWQERTSMKSGHFTVPEGGGGSNDGVQLNGHQSYTEKIAPDFFRDNINKARSRPAEDTTEWAIRILRPVAGLCANVLLLGAAAGLLLTAGALKRESCSRLMGKRRLLCCLFSGLLLRGVVFVGAETVAGAATNTVDTRFLDTTTVLTQNFLATYTSATVGDTILLTPSTTAYTGASCTGTANSAATSLCMTKAVSVKCAVGTAPGTCTFDGLNARRVVIVETGMTTTTTFEGITFTKGSTVSRNSLHCNSLQGSSQSRNTL